MVNPAIYSKGGVLIIYHGARNFQTFPNRAVGCYYLLLSIVTHFQAYLCFPLLDLETMEMLVDKGLPSHRRNPCAIQWSTCRDLSAPNTNTVLALVPLCLVGWYHMQIQLRVLISTFHLKEFPWYASLVNPKIVAPAHKCGITKALQPCAVHRQDKD